MDRIPEDSEVIVSLSFISNLQREVTVASVVFILLVRFITAN